MRKYPRVFWRGHFAIYSWGGWDCRLFGWYVTWAKTMGLYISRDGTPPRTGDSGRFLWRRKVRCG